jgi:hypothetical protein
MATFNFNSTTPLSVTVVLSDEERTAVAQKSTSVGVELEDYVQDVLSGPIDILVQQYRDNFAGNLMRRFNAADAATQAQALAQLENILPNV